MYRGNVITHIILFFFFSVIQNGEDLKFMDGVSIL